MADHPTESSNTHRFTNALAGETSPYLLQHAHNPVDWHPWGAEAFDRARAEQRPIFLSVGYSTCYWCHVMERQCFENEPIAALMNQHFVNVKVDREERPDVDDIYMIAVQAMTQRGGWPMSVFITPPGAKGASDIGLKPFYAGTYFPPESTYHGIPAFPDLLQGISKAWNEDRANLIEQADRVADAVVDHLAKVDQPDDLSVRSITQAANNLLRIFDTEHGGFGSAPKFPQPSNLLFLLAVYQNNREEVVKKAVQFTLERMARGGMYDQIGGGFHRYSVDEQWLVPHFEKMLYDNGQLLETYAKAQLMPDEADAQLYPRVIHETCRYLEREMRDNSGALWSAQDAEVNHKEGDNYLWTPDEIDEAINNPEQRALAKELYGLNEGTNFKDPHAEGVPPRNVIYLPTRLDEFAQARSLSVDELATQRDIINKALLQKRDTRDQPGTDDKVLTSWNGLAIAGLAHAGAATGSRDYIDKARDAADAVLAHMSAPGGGLYRTMRKGEAKIPAFLEDYAFFIHGLLALHTHRTDKGETKYLDEAKRLVGIVTERFAADEHQGGYYDTLADQRDLFVRVRSSYDGALPSGNSQMVHDLLDLYEITQDKAYLARALNDLRSFSSRLRREAMGMIHMQHALLRAMTLAPEAVDTTTTEQAPPGQQSQPQRGRQTLSVEVEPETIDLSTGEAAIEVRLRIGDEFHLNAHEPGDDALIPTALLLENAPGLTMTAEYPPGTPRRYEFADSAIAVYEGTVVIKAVIRGRFDQSQTRAPQLMLRYQMCTERSCLEPKTSPLPVDFA